METKAAWQAGKISRLVWWSWPKSKQDQWIAYFNNLGISHKDVAEFRIEIDFVRVTLFHINRKGLKHSISTCDNAPAIGALLPSLFEQDACQSEAWLPLPDFLARAS